MKATLLIAIRLLALIILYFVCFAAVSGALLSPAAEQSNPVQAGEALAALLAVSFLTAAILAYVIIRSRWAGWKLIVTIFFVLYGVTTVMPQIETAFFVTRLPPGMLPRLFLAGAIIAALFSPLAVLVLGKRKPAQVNDKSRLRLKMPLGEWVVKLCLIVIAYLIIYFTFGYFIAWKSAAVRAYYGGRDPGTFLAQISSVIRETPSLLPLQAVRAILWAAIAVPVIRMMKGQWWEAGLAVALLFGVMMTSPLLLPNPLMPREVRMVHLLETASSNFLFGWLIVLVLIGHHGSERKSAGNPRVFVDPQGHARIVRPHELDYHNNAACVGGGTRVYGAQAWRFCPKDFRMAGEYGVPEGSSLADWPISYEDLEPFYDRAEWELGVAGDGQAIQHLTPRRRGYPLPPVPSGPQTAALKCGAQKLGWATSPVPLLINTEPYGGRAACICCKYCVGFACPTDAKNGTHNTMIPRALATGHCELITGAIAEHIETDTRGNVSGISYFVKTNGSAQQHSARANVVVVSAGAVESARVLLNSNSTHHPRGLGNEHDQVGRNLQGHLYPRAYGLMNDRIFTGVGPGVTVATTQFNHGNDGVIGGGMLADDFIKPPIDFWYDSLPPDLPRWGIENKRFMRDNYTRVLHVRGPVQDIPSPEGRVTVDPALRDSCGIPVARLSGTTHPETVTTAEFMRERGVEWLRESGCDKIWSTRPDLILSGRQHQAGTCRMGHDPKLSVTDEWGRVHNHDNLFVVDGSLHVTNGGFNPVLTIMALAFRSAEHIARI